MVRITGVITGPDGQPVEDAAVLFISGPVPLPDIAQLTGPDGRFLLTAPARGVYSLQVNAPGHEASTIDFEVADEIEIERDVKLP
jgi:hypothetical protein